MTDARAVADPVQTEDEGVALARPEAAGITALVAGPRSLARTGQGDRAAAVRMLSRTAGNAAVNRWLAPARPVRRLSRVPQHKQWESPKAAEWYPGRQSMTRTIAQTLRMFELLDADEATRNAAFEAVIAPARTELAGLEEEEKGLAKGTKVDDRIKARRKRIGELKARVGTKGAGAIATLTSKAETEAFSNEKATAEFERLLKTGAAPEWMRDVALNYAGMQYSDGKGAHGTWFSARYLLYALELQRADMAKAAEKDLKKKGTIKADADLVKSYKAMSEETALQKLRDMRKEGQIPDEAWTRIETNTSIRLDKEKITPTAAAAADAATVTLWKKAQDRWVAGSDALGGEEGGNRSWLTALNHQKLLVATSVVCNQVAESLARYRGISGWNSGIGYDAQKVADDAAKAKAPVAENGRIAVAPYFRHAEKPDDFRPGAIMFFLVGRWGRKSSGHADVYYRSGLTYPNPNDPLPAEEKGKPKVKANANDREKWFDDIITAGEKDDGWTYTLDEGKAISRTNKEGETQYMQWLHMATVVRRIGDTIHTFETTGGTTGAGMSTRTVPDMSKPNIFVGYLPGDYGETVAAPVAPPAPAPPAPAPEAADPAAEPIQPG